MGYIYALQTPDSNTHLIEPKLYAVAGGTASAITASISNFVLETGVTVNIKVSTVNANATLNVNSTGAKNIFYNNTRISANQLKANHVYTLVYDGTQWQLIGDIDTDTQSNYGNITTSGTLSTASSLVVTDANKQITTGVAISPAISSQTQNTKFLREDGAWAEPSYTSSIEIIDWT